MLQVRDQAIVALAGPVFTVASDANGAVSREQVWLLADVEIDVDIHVVAAALEPGEGQAVGMAEVAAALVFVGVVCLGAGNGPGHAEAHLVAALAGGMPPVEGEFGCPSWVVDIGMPDGLAETVPRFAEWRAGIGPPGIGRGNESQRCWACPAQRLDDEQRVVHSWPAVDLHVKVCGIDARGRVCWNVKLVGGLPAAVIKVVRGQPQAVASRGVC